MTSSKKVLVTGATGLIGKELIEPLKDAGFDVFAITIDEDNPKDGVNWLKGSLFTPEFIKGIMSDIKPQYLLNMAWATTGDYLTSDINYKFLEAGKILLQEFALNGGKRTVFAGTCFEYKFKNEPLKEYDELEPEKNAYTSCKNKLHEYASVFCSDNNISFGYGRIFYVFGRNEAKTRLTGMLVDKLSRNEQVVINAGRLIKDYMYTKDIAGAFVQLLNSDVEGTVNICTGNPISIKDFSSSVANLLNKQELLKFEDKESNQPPIILGDNSRLINEVGFIPKYSLKQALEEVLCLTKC